MRPPLPTPAADWSVLAALRFALALVVLISDLRNFTDLPTPLNYLESFPASQAGIVFLFISGYSIAAGLAREPKGFYERRLNRIYPTYFAACILAVVPFMLYGPAFQAGIAGIEAPANVWPVIAQFAMAQGIFTDPLETFSPSWILPLLAVMYIIAPRLVRWSDRSLLVVGLACFVASIVPSLPGSFLELSWAWIAGLLFFRHGESRLAAWLATSVVALGCGALSGVSSPVAPTLLFVAMAIATSATRLRIPSALRRIADVGGSISLAMFLTHWQVFCIVSAAYPSVSPWLLIAGALVAAGLVYFAIDLPYRSYARRRGRPLSSDGTPTVPTTAITSTDQISVGANGNRVQWQILAGLRLCLAVVVVFNHIGPLLNLNELPLWMSRVKNLGGTEAVYCFFLISGYSIASSLERDSGSFAERRFWRLAPVYWAFLAYTYLPILLSGGHWTEPSGVIVRAETGLPLALAAIGLSYLFTPAVAFFGMTWSLTAEITYYSLAPLLSRIKPTAVTSVIAVSSCLFVIFNHSRFALSLAYLHYDAPALVLGWLWLAAFAYYRSWRHPLASSMLIALVMAMPLADLSGGEFSRFELYTTVSAICAAPFLGRVALPVVLSKAMSWAGDVSYPLYLSHIASIALAYMLIGRFAVGRPYLYVAAAILVAILILHIVDYPARRLAKWISARRGVPTVAQSQIE
jgi:peptidoglycan/LPS O-acetylase OafA/YrhL